MIKRILVGLAGTTFTHVAIQRAVALAKAQGADVTGVTVLDPHRLRSLAQPVPPGIGHPPQQSDRPIPLSPDSVEEAIQRLEQSCKEAGVKCRQLRETGDAFTTLIDAARYHDLIVFGLGSVLKYASPGFGNCGVLHPQR
jgi:nucleotide-binding universal stress UspA family protein